MTVSYCVAIKSIDIGFDETCHLCVCDTDCWNLSSETSSKTAWTARLNISLLAKEERWVTSCVYSGLFSLVSKIVFDLSRVMWRQRWRQWTKESVCSQCNKGEGKGKGLDTCYSAAYMSRLEQQRFTVSEVAADWHELMIPCMAHYAAIHCPR